MIVNELVDKYASEKSDKKIIIVTDFEKLIINIIDEDRYSFAGQSFIRFLKETLLEEFPNTNENFIDSVFFLPSDKCTEFEQSLADEEILGELRDFYNPEFHAYFKEGPTAVFSNTPFPSNKKGGKGISLYGADSIEPDELLEAGKQILELNAMRNYKIAYGNIGEGIGLLERSPNEKDTTPKSRHYNFWKFNKNITGKTFQDIACEFSLIN